MPPRNQLSTVTRINYVGGIGYNIGATIYTYDANGRLNNLQDYDNTGATYSNTTFTYDKASRLVTEVSGGTTTSYSYDAASELTAVTGGRTESYSYDLDG